jgi:AraC-like DNA-binding protein
MALTPTLWRLFNCGHQVVPAGRAYWFDNRAREPLGTVIFQMSIAGTIVYRDAHGEQTVPPGFGVLFVHGEPSAYGLLRGEHRAYENRWVSMIGAGLVEHINALRDRYGSVLDLRGDKSIERDMRELAALGDPTKPTGPTQLASAVHGFVMRLYERAERIHAAKQSPAERAVDQLLRQPVLGWSLKQVASQFGCSREHLTRLFRERVGQSPGRYIAQVRLEHALHLLRDSDLPMHAVAKQSGYLSTHTFRRHVLESVGQTPTAVRNRERRLHRPPLAGGK